MPSLQILKRKIETTDDLHAVVRTMKSLAAVNIAQFRRAVESLASYMETVELGLTVLLRNHPNFAITAGTDSKPASARRHGHVVFGSDQGLCGPLNEQMARYASQQFARNGENKSAHKIAVVGSRLADELQTIGFKAEAVFETPGSANVISIQVEKLADHVASWRDGVGIDSLELHHPSPAHGSSYEPRTVRLLPVDSEWLHGFADREWGSNMLPEVHGDPASVFGSLLRDYHFGVIFRAYAETLASENAARLAAMQAAQNNIEERQVKLTGQYQQQRQQQITEEMLDVVAGAEALG